MTDDAAGSELQVEGPMGWKATAKGPSLMIVVIICLCFTGLIGLSYVQHEQSMGEHKQRGAEHKSLQQGLNEVTYVLSLTDEQRTKLKLAMPDSLREKMRNRRNEE